MVRQILKLILRITASRNSAIRARATPPEHPEAPPSDRIEVAIDPHLDAEALAAEMAFLVTRRSVWVRRRSETIDIIEVGRIRRRIAVDFIQPTAWIIDNTPAQPAHSGVSFVPLMVVEKGITFEHFDLYDEDSMTLPLLSSMENAEIATSATLRALADDLSAGSISQHLYVEATSRTAEIVVATKSRASALHREIETIVGPGPYKSFISDTSSGVLLDQLKNGFLLIARIPGRTGDRRVIKVSFDNEGDPPTSVPARRGLFRQRFELESRGDAQSYHLEIAAPRGMTITDARGYYQDAADLKHFHATGPLGERAHLYFGSVPTNSRVVADVAVSLPADGIISGGYLVAGLSAVAYAILAIGFVPPAPEVEAGDFSAIVAALPGLIAAYFWQPSEHPYATAAAGPFRAALAAITIVAVLMAAILVVADINEWLRWWALIGASAVCFASCAVLRAARRQRSVDPHDGLSVGVGIAGISAFGAFEWFALSMVDSPTISELALTGTWGLIAAILLWISAEEPKNGEEQVLQGNLV